MAVLTNFPDIRPSLLLDFANSRRLDPRVSLVRATTGTIINAAGQLEVVPANSPRVDFDPVTGRCLGLLVEEQRTNLFTYSNDFTDAAWIKSNATIVPNNRVGIDGTLSMSKLVESTATLAHGMQRTVAMTGTSRTVQFLVAAGERTKLQVEVYGNTGNAGRRVLIDLSNATIINQLSIGSGGLNSFNVSIVAVRSMVQVSITIDPTVTTGNTVSVFFAILNASSSVVYAGDGTSGIYLSNAQAEAGAFPTSYIPTTTAQVTRAADKLTLAGANFSNWFRTDEGTLFADFASYAAGITTSIFTVDSGSQDNRVQMRNSGTANAADQVIVVAASVVVANMSLPGGTHLLGQFKKTALAYKVDDFRLGSGTHAVSDTAGALPVGMNIARIGDGISSNVLTGHIRKIAYYPQRLTNAQLQAITAD